MKFNGWNKLAAALLLANINLTVLAENPGSADHGVALVYHHIAEQTPATTSVSPHVFKRHLDYLQDNDYTVVPLSILVDALRNGVSVPDRAVAITFDDAYRSVYSTAAPLLQARDMPFTVFVSTQAIEQDFEPYMSWNEIKSTIQAGGTIGNHSHTHGHLSYSTGSENSPQWRSRVIADVTRAQTLIEQNLGQTPTMFAYPYGEFTPELAAIIAGLGLHGVGQHSGAIGFGSNFQTLPRHPFYTGADQITRFAERIDTRPLYVESHPENGLQLHSNPLQLTLKPQPGPFKRDLIRCYYEGRSLELVWRPSETFTTVLNPLATGRSKLNCTVKNDQGDGYHWWSYLLMGTPVD